MFIHAKCNVEGKLFELTQIILAAIPSDTISSFEDIYGFKYRTDRDLSGFIDGT